MVAGSLGDDEPGAGDIFEATGCSSAGAWDFSRGSKKRPAATTALSRIAIRRLRGSFIAKRALRYDPPVRMAIISRQL